jgi:hypothetical protein
MRTFFFVKNFIYSWLFLTKPIIVITTPPPAILPRSLNWLMRLYLLLFQELIMPSKDNPRLPLRIPATKFYNVPNDEFFKSEQQHFCLQLR